MARRSSLAFSGLIGRVPASQWPIVRSLTPTSSASSFCLQRAALPCRSTSRPQPMAMASSSAAARALFPASASVGSSWFRLGSAAGSGRSPPVHGPAPGHRASQSTVLKASRRSGMLFFIAYLGLFVVGLCELRHAAHAGDQAKVRLLAVAVLCHLLLAVGYLGKVELPLALVIG
jgi:hypothetical protein